MKLQKRTVIITGAARGIGQVLALRCAKEGANVVVADKLSVTDTVEKVKAIGGEVIGIAVDVASADSTLEMAREAAKKYGSIDVLVNNAAVWAGLKRRTLDAISEEEWDRVFSVNVKGIWQCCKAVVPYMKNQGRGSIINISSATVFLGIPLLGHYVASKGAVWAYTRSLSRELGEFGIRVNSITPGQVMTQASQDKSDDKAVQELVNARIIEERIIKRAMYPEDLEGAVVFLASDDSSFITGQNINVDGGAYHY